MDMSEKKKVIEQIRKNVKLYEGQNVSLGTIIFENAIIQNFF